MLNDKLSSMGKDVLFHPRENSWLRYNTSYREDQWGMNQDSRLDDKTQKFR
jgi:hypothetical protein